MIKIIILAIICGILCLYLKETNNEAFSVCLIASGILLLFESIEYISNTFGFINELIVMANLDNDLIKIIVKITLIGILIEWTASLLKDFSFSSLSDKLVFLGKMIIFSVSIPIFYSVISILKNLLEI